MKLAMIRPSRAALTLLICLLIMIASIAVPSIRITTLRRAGWILVREDPLEPVDVIVIAVDADGEGALEAADLIHEGVSTRAALFADPPDAVDREFLRRGIPYENAAAVTIRQLASLGVSNVELIPRTVAGTEDEAQVLPAWCLEHHVASVMLVSESDHSRRLRRMVKRSMQGQPTKIAIRSSRYSDFNPDCWWRTRGGVRIEIIELQKLVLDILRHPLSGY
jgi:hypothetical protein